MAMVAVRVDARSFARGVKYAKQFGGRFDPASKTWLIPAERPELSALGAYGLIRVSRPGCPQYTVDQGCPLHGETCA